MPQRTSHGRNATSCIFVTVSTVTFGARHANKPMQPFTLFPTL